MKPRDGVSFVIPVYNGARTLERTLASVLDQDDGRPLEVVVVDDGSVDGSLEILERAEADARVRVLHGDGRGAAAAINRGLAAARFPVVAQVDQDVALQPGWLDRLVKAVNAPGIGAAQGRYEPMRESGIFGRVMALDLADRYDRVADRAVDHVCTGNAVYRAEALREVGGLDETLGYGYDNDLSYRLVGAGWRLRLVPDATSEHRWREGLVGYLRQQYGLGYGRLDVVARHPARVTGDVVSGAAMIAHGPATLAALASAFAAVVLALAGRPWRALAAGAVLVLGTIALERLAAGVRAARRHRDWAGLLFPAVHVARDLAWSAAILVWGARRLLGRRAGPGASMRRLKPAAVSAATAGATAPAALPSGARVAVVIPAHNEAISLPAVVTEMRAARPDLPLVVVDDGSTDETAAVLPSLGVPFLRLGTRLGVGGAVRAGLRAARERGAEIVVRLDGDGQHDPADIPALVKPLVDGRADAVIGSRYLDGAAAPPGTIRHAGLRWLALLIARLTGQSVTDPTSGFWAFGPRAARLLAEHYPTGYSEPELRLFLARNGLRVAEVPARMRPRHGGRTSLTVSRTGHALARTLLALVVVPLRSLVRTSFHD